MFIGVIGYTYTTGLASVWLMIGWLAGDYIASTFVHKRLKAAAEKTGEVSYAGVLSQWYGANNSAFAARDRHRLFGILGGLCQCTVGRRK